MQRHVFSPVRIQKCGLSKRSNLYVTAQTTCGYDRTVFGMGPWSAPSMKVNMLRTLKDFEKCAIGASDGDIGRVKDVYFDDHAWVVRYLIVETGSWLLSREVLISPISILKPDWSMHTLVAAITRDQVKNSPDIDTDKPVSGQHEAKYLGYYGYPGYWGGTGMWGDGMVPMAMYPGDGGIPGGAAGRQQAIEESIRAERERHRDDDQHLRSCTAVIGYHIHATDGEVGHVDGFLIDDETWAIRYLVVNTSNWWLGHRVLVAPQWVDSVNWTDQTVAIDVSREAVKTAPLYDPSAELNREREMALYTHYDRPPYWNTGSTLEHVT
jgi:uncharacterized protein YrrD